MNEIHLAAVEAAPAKPTKRGWLISAETLAQARAALDAVAPYCAPVAERWDAESKRRDALRTPENLKALIAAQRDYISARLVERQASAQARRARADSKNPLSGARRAARTAQKASRAHRQSARIDLKSARRGYPVTLRRVAVRAHTAHTIPAAAASVAMSTPTDWAVWPVSTSVALIAANWAVLALGRLAPQAPEVDGDASAEERRLLERLDPSYWVQHADERGLSGTLTEHPELTAAGIACGVRLDGKWSAKALAAQGDSVRALLGMKTETRMQISRGSHGDRALIVIRTRSASDGVSMIWTPDHTGIGVDEVTGEFVDLPLMAGKHILAAGRTGMGKSVSWRPLVMRAVMADDWTAVVIDPKRQEAIGWRHCLRCVGQETDREERMARIYGMAKELTREMHRRQGVATGATWIPDGRPENCNLLVVIDEGAAIVRMSKRKEYADVLDLFEELWSEARSVGFQFVWATQFPTKAVGVPAAVKENMSAFLSLTVNPGEAERAIFGETAQQEGWLPSRLDGVPGRAMLQFEKRTPDPLRLWHVTDGMVAGLPKAAPWRGPDQPEAEEVQPAQLRLVKEEPSPTQESAASQGPSNRTKILAAVKAGARTNQAVADRIKVNKGTVSGVIKRLVESGELVRDESGLTLGEGVEVSA